MNTLPHTTYVGGIIPMSLYKRQGTTVATVKIGKPICMSTKKHGLSIIKQ